MAKKTCCLCYDIIGSKIHTDTCATVIMDSLKIMEVDNFKQMMTYGLHACTAALFTTQRGDQMSVHFLHFHNNDIVFDYIKKNHDPTTSHKVYLRLPGQLVREETTNKWIMCPFADLNEKLPLHAESLIIDVYSLDEIKGDASSMNHSYGTRVYVKKLDYNGVYYTDKNGYWCLLLRLKSKKVMTAIMKRRRKRANQNNKKRNAVPEVAN
jgi:hypothetical protein